MFLYNLQILSIFPVAHLLSSEILNDINCGFLQAFKNSLMAIYSTKNTEAYQKRI